MSSTDPSDTGTPTPPAQAPQPTPPGAERVEELLARAERVLRQPVPPPSPLERLRWPLVGAGVVAVIVLVAALTSGGSDGVSGQTTAVPLASTTSAVATTVPIVITLPPNTAATTTTAPAATTTTLQPETPRTTAFGVPARTITFQNGQLVLKGEVADQAAADAIRSALAASFGASAIVDQLQVVSDAPFTDADPLSAGTAVRFVDGQPVTDLASLRFLDQVADLLNRQPGVTADIHVSADSGGATLADQRATVIRQYLGGRGVAAERLTSTGDAASAPTAQLVVVFHHLAG